MHHIDERMRECIKLCSACRTECQEMLYSHCLEMGGKHVQKEHVKLMTDCIEACQQAAGFMSRDSNYHAATCATCAEICDACAESCERIGGEEMQRLAKICRNCAASCRDMAKDHNRKAA